MSNEQTDLSPAEAAKLGFKAPGATAPTAAQTTKVLGYFNNNPWPVHISLSSHGISLDVENRGDFVRDDKGNKINDPELDQFARPNMLSKELSDTPVPIRRIISQEQRPISETTSFHGTQEFKTTKSGQITEQSMRKAVVPAKASRNELAALQNMKTPIIGMTMEQARELGVVKPTVAQEITSPDDSTGVPVTGHIQSLEDITPRDALPGEARRLAATKAEQRAAVQKLQDAENQDQVQQTKMIESAIDHAPDPGQDAVAESIRLASQQAAQPVIAPQTEIVTEAMPAATAQLADTVQTPQDDEVEVSMNPVTETVASAEAFANEPLPEDDQPTQSRAMNPPDLGDDDPASAESRAPQDASSEEAKQKPFHCPVDNKRFTHRSLLNRHVTRQVAAGKMTADQGAGVMDAYPSTRKTYSKK